MADNYLQFSAVIPRLSPEEEEWLRQQLQSILVFGDQEFVEDDPQGRSPPKGKADYRGFRFLRDNPNFDPQFDLPGFAFRFDEEGDCENHLVHHLTLYAEEYGDPSHVAWLVQKFLQRFRPAESWSMTYAATCSKPRVGEFSGGALFVTGKETRWHDPDAFLEDCVKSFQRDKDAARLVEKARSLRIESRDLDDAVHDAVSPTASAVNNAGLIAQIAFLVEQLGTEETQRLIEETCG